MKYFCKNSKNKAYFKTLGLIILSGASCPSRAILFDPENPEVIANSGTNSGKNFNTENLPTIIISMLENSHVEEKKSVCWICGKSITPKDLSKLTCGHSAYHNNCEKNIGKQNIVCPLCETQQSTLIKN